MSPDNQEPITPQNQPEALQPQPTVMQPPIQPTQVAIVDPGQTFGIIGILLGVFGFALIGLILSVLGNNKAKAAGVKSTVSVIGIWLNAIFLVLGILIFALLMVLAVIGAASE